MLNLKRRPGDSIVIDGPCVVRFGRCANGHAIVGVEAAPDVKILRGELQELPPRGESQSQSDGKKGI